MCDEAMRMRERHTYQKWSESHCSCVLSGNSSHLHHPSWTHHPSQTHRPSQYNDGHKSTLLPMRGHTSHHHHWRGRTHNHSYMLESAGDAHSRSAPSMLDPPTRTLDAGPSHPHPRCWTHPPQSLALHYGKWTVQATKVKSVWVSIGARRLCIHYGPVFTYKPPFPKR